MVTLPAPPAFAAAAIEPPTFGGTADAAGVQVDLHLPVPAPFPVIGSVQDIVADISSAQGTVGDAAAPGATVASADLLLSNLLVLQEAANKHAEASGPDAEDDSDTLPELDLGLIGIGAGNVDASVTSTPTSNSSATLMGFRVGLGDVPDLASQAADTSLAGVAASSAEQSVVRGDGVDAHAESSVNGISVLGELVTVDGIETTVTATAAGEAGTAAAEVSLTIDNLRVADVLELDVGPDGATGTVLGNQLPAGVPFDDVLTQVNGVLATAGIQLIGPDVDVAAESDGTSATASTTGFQIVVNPLKAAEPLAALRIGAASVTAQFTSADIEPDEDSDDNKDDEKDDDDSGDDSGVAPTEGGRTEDRDLPATGGGAVFPLGAAMLVMAAVVGRPRAATRRRRPPGG
jgi:hypothetical protein